MDFQMFSFCQLFLCLINLSAVSTGKNILLISTIHAANSTPRVAVSKNFFKFVILSNYKCFKVYFIWRVWNRIFLPVSFRAS